MSILDSFEGIGSGLFQEIGELGMRRIGTGVENLGLVVGEALQDTVVPDIGQVAITETSPVAAIEAPPSNVIAFKPKHTTLEGEQSTNERAELKAMGDNARRLIEGLSEAA